MSRPSRLLVPVVLTAAALLAACSSDEPERVNAGGDGGDATMSVGDIAAAVDGGDFESDGADIYKRSCAVCHGGDGQGGTGPELVGVADELTVADHVSVVVNGRAGMPPWKTSLTPDEIAAVVAYERTELDG
jgi:mono/diheme cytochrome c family protein